MSPESPFRFMDLPLEIRLMVYERIPIHIKPHQFTNTTVSRNGATNSYSFAVIAKSVELPILTACRQVHTEASLILQRKMADILSTPPRLVIDILQSNKLYKCGGPLWHISRHLAERARKLNKSLGTVPYLGTGSARGGARYQPESDPDHPKLACLVARWIQSLEYERAQGKQATLEIGLTSRPDVPHETTLYALRQLAYILFAEKGGFRFSLRNVAECGEKATEEMRMQAKLVIDKVLLGRAGDVSRAEQGRPVESAEFDEVWSEGSYYRAGSY
jgi:hypothetical protein